MRLRGWWLASMWLGGFGCSSSDFATPGGDVDSGFTDASSDGTSTITDSGSSDAALSDSGTTHPPSDTGTTLPPPSDTGTTLPPPSDTGTTLPPPSDGGAGDAGETGPACPAPPATGSPGDLSTVGCDKLRTMYLAYLATARGCGCAADCSLTTTLPTTLDECCDVPASEGASGYPFALAIKEEWDRRVTDLACAKLPCVGPACTIGSGVACKVDSTSGSTSKVCLFK